MGNKVSCCAYSSPVPPRKSGGQADAHYAPDHYGQAVNSAIGGGAGIPPSSSGGGTTSSNNTGVIQGVTAATRGQLPSMPLTGEPNLPHISEREFLDELESVDPSVDPSAATMFLERSKQNEDGSAGGGGGGNLTKKKSQTQIYQNGTGGGGGGGTNGKAGSPSTGGGGGGLKKSSSCSTIYLDDSTVSQPNLKNTVKCVSLAIYYHIKNRASDRRIEIFDEKLHPLTRDSVPEDYDRLNPEHRQIYKFVRTLFNAAQLVSDFIPRPTENCVFSMAY